ncbi:hypothetical protein ACO0LM_02260 [Undibacterium sp. Di26W]|uniref:hypothetical protein n=1 Tax=Undibacterium sp. Di26W TaxID=3413035 RepID=UPI003BF0BA3A
MQDHCYNGDNQRLAGSVEKMVDDGQFRECVVVPSQAPQWRAIEREKSHWALHIEEVS